VIVHCETGIIIQRSVPVSPSAHLPQFVRRSSLSPVVFSLCIFALAALACNFPGVTANQASVTLTAANDQASTATAIASATLGAQQGGLALTQTALVPTITNTVPVTDTSTPTATATPLPAGVTPSQTSVSNNTLAVGVEAFIHTTSGDPLFMRDAAAKKGKLLASLPSDARVKIVDGPQAADGFLWWKVQVLTDTNKADVGKSGWCIESDGKIQTLVLAK
jgi:hypothetical protein